MSVPKVVVVGAGAVGLFCALRLAERGAKVTLLEGDRDFCDGASASLAAAGMIGPIAEGAVEGPRPHPQAVELGLASFDLWRAAPAALQHHARFEGVLILGPPPETHGRSAETLSRVQIAKRFEIEVAEESGMFVADEGVVEPAAMLRALAHAFRAAGGVLHTGVDVDAVEAKPWLNVRGLGGEMLSADRVVLAPGVWARKPLKEIAPALKRVRAAKGCLAPVTLDAALKINVRAPDFYLAPRAEGDVVLGSTMEFDRTDRRADPAQITNLIDAAQLMLPGQVRLAEAPAWAGVRPMSPDWAPMIGPSGPEGVFVACGHSRNGWLLAPITAEIICARVFGEDLPPLWAAFAPDRFE